MNSRVQEYDLLRIISFFLILIHHCINELASKDGYHDWMSNLFTGGVGVSFFILLSGGSLAITQKNSSILGFYRKRLSSILPQYWVAYFTVLLTLFVIDGSMAMGDNIYKIMLSIVAMDGYLGSTVNTYYLIGEWFTGFILILYIVSPLLIRLVKEKPATTFFITLLVSYASVALSDYIVSCFPVWNKVPLWNPSSRVAEFFLGMMIGVYLLKKNKAHLIAAILSMLYIVIVTQVLKQSFLQFSLLGCSLCAALYIVLIYALGKVKLSERVMGIISFLSQNSFMAFLFHHQIIILLVRKVTVDTTSASGFIYVFFVAGALSYLMAYVCQKPVIHLRKLVFGM